MTRWGQVRLGELLQRSEEVVNLDPETEYREITVRLWGKGVVERGRRLGAELAGSRRFAARPGQLILSRIDARNGAVGLVPRSLDGAVVSNDFPLFDIDRARVLPEFLGWLARSESFVELCQRASEGTTNRVRLQEERFLVLEVPLPLLAEQRRVVARIEEVAEQMKEAQGLRRSALEESAALLIGRVGTLYDHLATRHGLRDLGSFRPHVTSGPRNWAKHYEKTGYRFYRAQDIGPAGSVTAESKVFVTPPTSEQGRSALLREGDLMFVVTGATVGRLALFGGQLEPGFVSQHVAICRLPSRKIASAYALWMLRGPQGQDQLLRQRYGQGKPGLNLTNIRALTVPVPPLLADQRRVVAGLEALQLQVDALKRVQAEIAAEVDALLPSVLDRAFRGELV